MRLIELQVYRRWLAIGLVGWVAVFLAYLILGSRGSELKAANANDPMNRTSGLLAFADVASVVRSPRCINCHPAGDVPRQTNLKLSHFPNVRRGDDNHGVIGMRCSTCHQQENQANGIPGAKNWGLAPRSMAWEGLDDHALAEQLKDPNRNGHRTLEQMIEHVTNEPLVMWAWAPGGTRTSPPLSHEQFIQRFKDWVAAGAPSPESPTK